MDETTTTPYNDGRSIVCIFRLVNFRLARVVKLVDTADLKSAAYKTGVPVRFRFRAPQSSFSRILRPPKHYFLFYKKWFVLQNLFCCLHFFFHPYAVYSDELCFRWCDLIEFLVASIPALSFLSVPAFSGLKMGRRKKVSSSCLLIQNLLFPMAKSKATKAKLMAMHYLLGALLLSRK